VSIYPQKYCTYQHKLVIGVDNFQYSCGGLGEDGLSSYQQD